MPTQETPTLAGLTKTRWIRVDWINTPVRLVWHAGIEVAFVTNEDLARLTGVTRSFVRSGLETAMGYEGVNRVMRKVECERRRKVNGKPVCVAASEKQPVVCCAADTVVAAWKSMGMELWAPGAAGAVVYPHWGPQTVALCDHLVSHGRDYAAMASNCFWAPIHVGQSNLRTRDMLSLVRPKNERDLSDPDGARHPTADTSMDTSPIAFTFKVGRVDVSAWREGPLVWIDCKTMAEGLDDIGHPVPYGRRYCPLRALWSGENRKITVNDVVVSLASWGHVEATCEIMRGLVLAVASPSDVVSTTVVREYENRIESLARRLDDAQKSLLKIRKLVDPREVTLDLFMDS